MAHKGKFKPINPSKYKGDPTNIVYRSRWEFVVMKKLDEHPGVLEWSSEEIVIPYRSPMDNKVHRYFPDFYVKKKDNNGTVESMLIEVKPHYQTVPPPAHTTNGSKPTRRYLTEVYNWGINRAKWDRADEYCKDRGWKFVIITEKELGLTF